MKLLSPPSGFFVESGRRLPYLDLLRTLAITFVMIRHFIEFTPDYLRLARESDWEIWRFGITGVDLFFVLSGFLIFSMLFKLQQSNRLAVKDFFVGRILRIWPAYFVSIFVVAIFSSFKSLTHIPIFLLFLQNYVLVSPNVNGGIYWTLAVEEHFYLFAPLLVILLSRPNRYRTFAYFAVLLCLPVAFRFASFFYGQVDLTTLTRQSHYRIDTIMCGVLIAYLFHHFPEIFTRSSLRIVAVCLALILFPITVISMSSMAHGPAFGLFQAIVGISLPGYLYAAILFIVLSLRGASLPGTRFWRPIAHLSYSMYLYHLFGVIIANSIFAYIGQGKVFIFLHFVVFFAVTVVLTTISYILVEGPFLLARERYRLWSRTGPGGDRASAN